jgi:hypothetical protein
LDFIKTSSQAAESEEGMCSTEKASLYNETRKTLEELLSEIDDKLGRKSSLDILASILNDYGLDFLSSLVKADYEPSITNRWLQEDCSYDEGNDEAGHIGLSNIFEFVEEILNKADEERLLKLGNRFVRLETPEEMEEEGHSNSVIWYKEDEEIDLKKLVGFTVE